MNKNSSFGQKCSENIPVERKPYPSYQLGVNSRNWSAEYSLWTTFLPNGIRIETTFKTSNAYTLISLFCFEGQRPLVERAGLHIGKSFQIFSHLKTNQLVSFPLNFFSLFLLGRCAKNQNGNLRWHLPWRGGGLEGISSATYLFWKMIFVKNHLENVFCT